MTPELCTALMRVIGITVCPVDGQSKDRGHCFCKRCYFALTEQMRLSLHVSADEVRVEFCEQYVRCIQHLARLGLYVKRQRLPLSTQKLLRQSGLYEAWRRDMKAGVA